LGLEPQKFNFVNVKTSYHYIKYDVKRATCWLRLYFLCFVAILVNYIFHVKNVYLRLLEGLQVAGINVIHFRSRGKWEINIIILIILVFCNKETAHPFWPLFLGLNLTLFAFRSTLHHWEIVIYNVMELKLFDDHFAEWEVE
jgi:hypothetical protein